MSTSAAHVTDSDLASIASTVTARYHAIGACMLRHEVTSLAKGFPHIQWHDFADIVLGVEDGLRGSR